ncbi:MAG: hypothetical protein ABIT76_09650 [Chthoniobacterales bacterium]
MKTTLFVLLLVTVNAFTKPMPESVVVPLPKAPLVALTPDNATWSFKLQTPALKKGKPRIVGSSNMIIKVRTTQTGRLKLEEVTFSDKHTTQYWYVEGTILMNQADDGQLIATMVEPDWNRFNLTVPTGFTGFQWLKKENYIGVVDFDGRPSYHYLFDKEGGVKREAWVEVSTNRPLAFREGNSVYAYAFPDATPKTLVLPERLQTALQKIRREVGYRDQLSKDIKLNR